MRAILIDPFKKTVTDVMHNGDYKQIYDFIDCNCFVGPMIKSGDTMYCDDNGLTGDLSEQKFFKTTYFPTQPIAGKALILGVDDNGDSIEPSISAAQMRNSIIWMDTP